MKVEEKATAIHVVIIIFRGAIFLSERQDKCFERRKKTSEVFKKTSKVFFCCLHIKSLLRNHLRKINEHDCRFPSSFSNIVISLNDYEEKYSVLITSFNYHRCHLVFTTTYAWAMER